jgi:transcription elongation factor GreA-like protein
MTETEKFAQFVGEELVKRGYMNNIAVTGPELLSIVVDILDAHVRDSKVLDQIAEMLRDPYWSVSMLEDIIDLVSASGRNTATQLDKNGEPISTWERH